MTMVYLKDPAGRPMYAALACTQATIDRPVSLEDLCRRNGVSLGAPTGARSGIKATEPRYFEEDWEPIELRQEGTRGLH